MSFQVTAADMARAEGVDPKRFRQALRNSNDGSHGHNDRWLTEKGSAEHRHWQSVLAKLTGKPSQNPFNPARNITRLAVSEKKNPVKISDESYVLDICDKVLQVRSIRQHCFDFLRGDFGKNGQARMLPVDSWYPSLNLVIEYREIQHTESVLFFDRRVTISGVGRGEQRRIYDQRRRDVLPQHGISLIELNFSDFEHDNNKRLKKMRSDQFIIEKKLSSFKRSA